MREPYDTHGARVAELAVRMATAVGLTSEEVELVHVGAHLHDIGKLLIRTDVLNATRKLTEAEAAEMQLHTKFGWQIVSQAGYAKIIQNIVLHHHEKWNGNGYSNGLQKSEIPIHARIVAICDVYEALTSRRAYRDPYTHEFSKALMLKLRGSDFDPELTDLFFERVAVGPLEGGAL